LWTVFWESVLLLGTKKNKKGTKTKNIEGTGWEVAAAALFSLSLSLSLSLSRARARKPHFSLSIFP